MIATMINEEGLKSFVEVGCKEGRTTAFVLRHCPDVRVTAIDPWSFQPGQESVPGGESYEKWDFSVIEEMFRKNVEGHEDRVTFIRETGNEAAKQIGSADIVFIDGAHDYDSVLNDISVWRGKATRILCGHDFNHKWPTVNRAVADSFNLVHVQVAPDSVWWVRCG